MSLFKFAAYTLFFATTPMNAQSSQILGILPTIDHSGRLTEKINYGLYLFDAINLFNSKPSQFKSTTNFFVTYSELSLSYDVTSKISATASYVFERQFPLENLYRNENRFYLQASLKGQFKHINSKHRLRFDGRFIENRTTFKNPFTSRIRYQFGINVPLIKENDKYYFSAYNEFFVNLNKNTIAYDENWAYLGLGLKLNKSNSLELGILNIFWVNNRKYQITNFDYLQLAWVSKLDFRKKK